MAEGTVEVVDEKIARYAKYRDGVVDALKGYSPGHDPESDYDRKKQLGNDVSRLSNLVYLAGKNGQQVTQRDMDGYVEIIDEKVGRDLKEERERMMKGNDLLSRYVKEEEND